MKSWLTIDQAWSEAASVAALNEDGWGIVGSVDALRAYIIDGCTDYDPVGSSQVFPGGTTSAFWHKETLSAAFRTISWSDGDLVENLICAIDKVKLEFDALGRHARPVWTLPCSTLVIVEVGGDQSKLRIAAMGDCTVLLKFRNGGIERFPAESPDSDSELEVARLLHETGDTISAQEKRRGRRQHFLESGSHCVSLFSDRLAGLKVFECSRDDVSQLLLATDGFMRLVDVFSSYTLQSLFENVPNVGLHKMVEELRELERNTAPVGKSSRIKVHDDATAVVLKLG